MGRRSVSRDAGGRSGRDGPEGEQQRRGEGKRIVEERNVGEEVKATRLIGFDSVTKGVLEGGPRCGVT